MGRKVDVDQLVGAREIANRLGVKRSGVVHDWHHRHPEFPEPVTQLEKALVWYWPEVERWARKTGRYPQPAN
jgi:predicted DNA-binding transcriptional regulator AlpA